MLLSLHFAVQECDAISVDSSKIAGKLTFAPL